MIDHIKGKILAVGNDNYLVDIGNLVLKFKSPSNFTDKDSFVYVELFIKEDRFELYGFKTREERDLFNQLISVTGVGMKHAISMLKTFSVAELIEIIESSDVTSLTTIPGIGKKTAQRIIFELQGKLSFGENDILEDIVEALVSLGFDRRKSVQVAKEVFKETKEIEKALKLALQKLTEKG
ncbi:Holliday junction branch migration protein RuvA [Persephonella sp.]